MYFMARCIAAGADIIRPFSDIPTSSERYFRLTAKVILKPSVSAIFVLRTSFSAEPKMEVRKELIGKEIEQIRLEYITGSDSLRALAKKYGVARSTVGEHSRHDEWVKAREEYRKGVRDRVLEEKTAEDAEKLLVLAESTEKAVALAAKAFEDPDQFNRYLVSEKVRYAEGEEGEGDGIVQRQWTEERIFKKTDTKALKEMTAVLRDLTGLMREFHGIPTKAQAERARIAAERLELEKLRMQRSENVNAVEVIMDAGEEAWNE